ncbi:MAG: flavin monoamine oxidase family protein [Bacteroidia bacterium]
MNRRELIRLLGLGIPAGLILPSAFTACREEDLFEGKTYSGKVIVVGAGVAGMYATYLLHKRGADVTLLEASSVYGGRIRSLAGFSDFPIELGAEEVHGQRSIFYDLLRDDGVDFVDVEDEDFYSFVGSVSSAESQNSNPDIQKMNALVENMSDYDGGDVTADEYIDAKGYSLSTRHLLNALLGNEFGASNDRLGLKGVSDADKLWTAGNRNFLLKGRSILSALESKFAAILPKIRLNVRVQEINYSGNQIQLTDQNNAVYLADKVIVAVPLTVLRDSDIQFIPALSSERTNAFSRIGMGAGMKVILKFNNRFWPENLGSLYGSGPVPEYWATGAGRSGSNNMLTAFVHGEKAEQLNNLNNASIINTILSDLDDMYGANTATGNLAASHIMNWYNEPFIRGTYSYPIPGGAGARELIAAPIDKKLFFAGEATHTAGHFATVHGAIETGLRAVDEILKSI